MENNNKLKGSIVMLRPELWEILADSKDVIGEIISADIDRDDFYVQYGKNSILLHSSDAVSVLKSYREIYDLLDNAPDHFSNNDLKDLQSLALLLEYGSAKHQRTAMELLFKNPGIREAATRILEDQLAIQQNKERLVMVSPVLWTSERVGQVGTIEPTDLTDGKTRVKFDDGEVDSYSPKTLFVLKSADELITMAENPHGIYWDHVVLQLKSLAILQASGSVIELKNAMASLNDDPGLHGIATIRLNEARDLLPKNKIGR
jgi:hypothetical protein